MKYGFVITKHRGKEKIYQMPEEFFTCTCIYMMSGEYCSTAGSHFAL